MDYFKITTDETLRETVQHGSERYPFAYYPEDIWQFDFHRIDWHWHHELEFLYVAEGTAICFIGTSKVELHKGCGIFINSGVLHCFEARSSTFTPNIVFAPTLLASENSLIYEKYILPVINSAVEYQIFDPNSTSERSALQLMLQIFELQENGQDNEVCTIQLLLQFWNILFKDGGWNSDSDSLQRLNHNQARLQIMMQYIHEHYAEEITLEMIAASASISKSGALHIFQSGIHCSPVAYLIQYRLPDNFILLKNRLPPLQMKPDLQVPATFAGSSDSIIIGVQRNTERKKRKKVLKVCFITTHYKKRVL